LLIVVWKMEEKMMFVEREVDRWALSFDCNIL